MVADELGRVADAFVRRGLGIAIDGYSKPVRRTIAEIVRRIPDEESTAIRELEETCSIPETYFYRHDEQWPALGVALRDRIAREPTRPIRAWSAGSASGEEAYSLAHLLHGLGATDAEILATDMSATAIRRARRGVYRAWSLRGLDDARIDEIFDRDGDEFSVKEALRSRVRFERGNLVRDEVPLGLDLIVCRNVFIYFDRAAAASVLRRFRASLVEGGVLLLGPFDPMSDVAATLFTPVPERPGFFMKSRRAAASARRPSRPPTAHAHAPAPVPAVSGIVAPPERPAPPLGVVGRAERPADPGSRPFVDELIATAKRGRSDEVVRRYVDLRERMPDAIELHLVAALAYWDSGRESDALAAARAAFLLDPTSTVAEATFGIALARAGERDRALPLLRDALATLESNPDLAIAGVDPLDLRLAVETELEATRAN